MIIGHFHYQYWNPFIHPSSTIEDAPTEYLFPRSGGRFTGIRDRKRLWSKDNDPVARTRTGKKKERATVTYAQMDGEEKWSGPCFIWRARLSSAHCKIYTVSLPKRVGRQLHKRVQHFILHLNPPSSLSLSPPPSLYSKILVTDLILLIKFFVEIEKKGEKKKRKEKKSAVRLYRSP